MDSVTSPSATRNVETQTDDTTPSPATESPQGEITSAQQATSGTIHSPVSGASPRVVTPVPTSQEVKWMTAIHQPSGVVRTGFYVRTWVPVTQSDGLPPIAIQVKELTGLTAFQKQNKETQTEVDPNEQANKKDTIPHTSYSKAQQPFKQTTESVSCRPKTTSAFKSNRYGNTAYERRSEDKPKQPLTSASLARMKRREEGLSSASSSTSTLDYPESTSPIAQRSESPASAIATATATAVILGEQMQQIPLPAAERLTQYLQQVLAIQKQTVDTEQKKSSQDK